MIKHRDAVPSRQGSKDSSFTDRAAGVRWQANGEESLGSSPLTHYPKNHQLNSSVRKSSLPAEYSPVTTVEKSDVIWSMYVKEAHARDKEMLLAWSNNMDVLLVFAGLFSAILTAFLIELHQELKPSTGEFTNVMLGAILQRLDYIADNTTQKNFDIPDKDGSFTRDVRNTRVNFYWFTSLTFSLLAAAGAMLAKQWIQEYSRDYSTGSFHDQALLRQERFDGLERWRFRTVVELLPTLMHMALILFFCGLIDFLWGLYKPVGALMLTLFLSGIAFALTTAIIAIIVPDCPYQTRPTRKLGGYLRALSRCLETTSQQQSSAYQGGRRDDAAKHKDMGALIWLLRESRVEDSVRASLKLVPAVNGAIDHRDQLYKLGAISRICELFDPAHPFHHRIVERDAFAFGLALRSLLSFPRPELPESLSLQHAIQAPLNYMADHPNINLRILAASFAPLVVMNVEDAQYPVIGWEMADKVANNAHEVELWARILFLDALQEWMIYICHHAPKTLALKPENSPVVILELITRVGTEAPQHHITPRLLSSLLCSMTVTLGARDVMHVSPPDSGAPIADLGDILLRCLKEMYRNKLAHAGGHRAVPGIDYTNAPAVIPLYDVEASLVRLLSIINRLLPQHPTLFGSSWNECTTRLIDFSHDSREEEVVAISLGTLLLCERKTLVASCSLEHNKRLLRMCIVTPGLSTPMADDSFLGALGLMEHILPLLGTVNDACEALLDNADSLSPLLVEGLRRNNHDIHLIIMRIIGLVFDNPSTKPETADELADQLVKAGLLRSLFKLVKQELFKPGVPDGINPTFGPKLTEIVKPIGWLARSPESRAILLSGSALEDLVTITQHKKSYYGKDYAARAIILLWDSAISNSTESTTESAVDLTTRIVNSGFLSTLSSWFESDNVGDSLYKSYQELQSVWLGLLKRVFELQPTALGPLRPKGHYRARSSPSPRGLLSSMINYLATTASKCDYQDFLLSEREALMDLLDDLTMMNRKVSELGEQEEYTPLSSCSDDMKPSLVLAIPTP